MKNRIILCVCSLIGFLILTLSGCNTDRHLYSPKLIEPQKPLLFQKQVTGSKTKKITINLYNAGKYAHLSLYADDKLLVDNVNIPVMGLQTVNTLVNFEKLTELSKPQLIEFKLVVKGANLTIHDFIIEDIAKLTFPNYNDVSQDIGMDKVSSIKYGGPTVADFDNDGDYDFIVNNHNAESSKLYWNNGDGSVSKHNKNLARWFMHDLHGTAAGDYDNDGDLDVVVTMGGGNGKNPSKANFYHNNQGSLVLNTGDVNIDRGGRGRGAKWSDMDLDGDLDLMLINEASLTHSKPQHYFYKNLGNDQFEYTSIKGMEDQEPSRALITDLNGDQIDDLILYSPLSVWQGNGDFTFTEITSKLPKNITTLTDVMAVTDIDIDNDGDLDLYLARGKAFENGYGESPSVDHDPIAKTFSIKPRGYKGVDEFDFIASGEVKFHQYNYLAQGEFRGKDYHIFLGSHKIANVLKPGEELVIEPEKSIGWPDDISENGVYFGYLGKNKWRSALVRNGNIFWTFKFSLTGVEQVSLGFEPENRNNSDVLLENKGELFSDVSLQWNIPAGVNSLGVTVGDFNNDSHQDLFVYRWGLIGQRISDYMLLNTGNGYFENLTMHGANDIGGPGNGDMGQAFDFDLDGDLELLNGSEDGEWYLYNNQIDQSQSQANYALVRVGYSPESNVDPISAEVIIETANNTYRKRVGSAGAIFSQSLLNIVHFGLGNAEKIKSIQVKWRNGENIDFTNKSVNQMFDTDKQDPDSIRFAKSQYKVRQNSSSSIKPLFKPTNVNTLVSWSTSNDKAITVNQNGELTVIGNVGDTAVISAKSHANGLVASSFVSIIDWYPIALKSIKFDLGGKLNLVEGQQVKAKISLEPNFADYKEYNFTSTNEAVASVDVHGNIVAKTDGTTNIQVTAIGNKNVSDSVEVEVKPLIKPFIEITNHDEFSSQKLVIGDEVKVKVKYHAGTGNKVISSDEGGIRFWLRHFKSKWFPVKDIVLIDKDVLYTESGESEMTISLAGLIPTSELPEGHFYLLQATFVSSSGTELSSRISPLDLVHP
ncbi:FG-GAP-like repeat-containing protein [Shewanella sp. 10N.286.48.A6]|uniref:FG-GAP-like repeat-containing protein n=1 Tax=Shewanella sp. 10N.286.48.A6 TaxID=1880833 RepID=UPI000C867759|nr:FG-GAP-like repeat-containing protein [Shewanella sp. 10N.286.48.A6]PMI02111.1 hypothetical protein BCU55_08030 [Shewanella sp. 10N.286.48.A6]